MRLQCPNCDAEYEVDASAIPFDGRDVQCSNCGHGWFQVHPDFEADQDIEAALYDPPPPLPQDIRSDPQPRPAFANAAPPDPWAEDAGTQQEPPKREIDPQALRILREEVAYEAAKRATEGFNASVPATSIPAPQSDTTSIEDELDQNIAAGANPAPSDTTSTDNAASNEDLRASVIVARRVARLKGSDAAGGATYATAAPVLGGQAATVTPAAPSQPQIAQGDLPDEHAPRKTGKKFGFYVGILAALASSAAYILAPEIAAGLPQIAGPLGQYVNAVNQLRDGLDGLIGTITGSAVPQVMQIVTDLAQRATAFVSQLGWF